MGDLIGVIMTFGGMFLLMYLGSWLPYIPEVVWRWGVGIFLFGIPAAAVIWGLITWRD